MCPWAKEMSYISVCIWTFSEVHARLLKLWCAILLGRLFFNTQCQIFFICPLPPFFFKSDDDKAGKVHYYMSCDGMKKVLIWSQLSPSVTLFGDKSRHSIASNEVQFLHFSISSFNKADMYCLKVCLNYWKLNYLSNMSWKLLKPRTITLLFSFISPTGLSFTDNLPAKNVLRIIDKRI